MSASAVAAIGERLREARLRRGISVRGLARSVDVSASLISQIETGKSSPSVSTLYAITTALGISIEDVFGEPDADRAGTDQGGTDQAGTEQGGTDRPGADADQAAADAAGAAAAGGGAAGVSGGDVAADEPGGAVISALAGLATGLAAGSPQAPAPASPVIPAAPPASATAEDSAGGQGIAHSEQSATAKGLRMLSQKRLVGPVVRADEREVLQLDSGVTWELLGQLPDTHVDFLRITYAPGGRSSSAGMLMRHSGTEFGHVLSGRLTLTLGFENYELGPGDSVCFDSSTPHAYANNGTEPAIGVWFVLERFR